MRSTDSQRLCHDTQVIVQAYGISAASYMPWNLRLARHEPGHLKQTLVATAL